MPDLPGAASVSGTAANAVQASDLARQAQKLGIELSDSQDFKVPTAEFVEEAQHWIGMGLFMRGKYEKAVDHWNAFHKAFPRSALRTHARYTGSSRTLRDFGMYSGCTSGMRS